MSLAQDLKRSIDQTRGRRFIPDWLFEARGRGMATDLGAENAREYHNIGHVRLDRDPTALVMVIPFAFANVPPEARS